VVFLETIYVIFRLTGLGIITAPDLDVVKASSAKAKRCLSYSG